MRLSHCASLLLAPLAFGLLAAARPAAAQTLTFEGLQNQEGIGDYYNGGLGSEGSGPGSNYGVTFSSNALAITSSAAGGSGNFSGEPSPSSILFFLGNNSNGTSAATLNDAGGFNTGFSFYYASNSNSTGFVTVYSGLNETGTVLATLALPDTPTPYSVFVPIGVSFDGTAKSVDFGGAADFIGFDDVTFNSATPNPTPTTVPEPSSVAAFAVGGLGVLGLLLRRKKAAAA